MYMYFSLQIFLSLGSMDGGCLKWGQNKKKKKKKKGVFTVICLKTIGR